MCGWVTWFSCDPPTLLFTESTASVGVSVLVREDLLKGYGLLSVVVITLYVLCVVLRVDA